MNKKEPISVLNSLVDDFQRRAFNLHSNPRMLNIIREHSFGQFEKMLGPDFKWAAFNNGDIGKKKEMMTKDGGLPPEYVKEMTEVEVNSIGRDLFALHDGYPSWKSFFTGKPSSESDIISSVLERFKAIEKRSKEVKDEKAGKKGSDSVKIELPGKPGVRETPQNFKLDITLQDRYQVSMKELSEVVKSKTDFLVNGLSIAANKDARVQLVGTFEKELNAEIHKRVDELVPSYPGDSNEIQQKKEALKKKLEESITQEFLPTQLALKQALLNASSYYATQKLSEMGERPSMRKSENGEQIFQESRAGRSKVSVIIKDGKTEVHIDIAGFFGKSDKAIESAILQCMSKFGMDAKLVFYCISPNIKESVAVDLLVKMVIEAEAHGYPQANLHILAPGTKDAKAVGDLLKGDSKFEKEFSKLYNSSKMKGRLSTKTKEVKEGIEACKGKMEKEMQEKKGMSKEATEFLLKTAKDKKDKLESLIKAGKHIEAAGLFDLIPNDKMDDVAKKIIKSFFPPPPPPPTPPPTPTPTPTPKQQNFAKFLTHLTSAGLASVWKSADNNQKVEILNSLNTIKKDFPGASKTQAKLIEITGKEDQRKLFKQYLKTVGVKVEKNRLFNTTDEISSDFCKTNIDKVGSLLKELTPKTLVSFCKRSNGNYSTQDVMKIVLLMHDKEGNASKEVGAFLAEFEQGDFKKQLDAILKNYKDNHNKAFPQGQNGDLYANEQLGIILLGIMQSKDGPDKLKEYSKDADVAQCEKMLLSVDAALKNDNAPTWAKQGKDKLKSSVKPIIQGLSASKNGGKEIADLIDRFDGEEKAGIRKAIVANLSQKQIGDVFDHYNGKKDENTTTQHDKERAQLLNDLEPDQFKKLANAKLITASTTNPTKTIDTKTIDIDKLKSWRDALIGDKPKNDVLLGMLNAKDKLELYKKYDDKYDTRKFAVNGLKDGAKKFLQDMDKQQFEQFFKEHTKDVNGNNLGDNEKDNNEAVSMLEALKGDDKDGKAKREIIYKQLETNEVELNDNNAFKRLSTKDDDHSKKLSVEYEAFKEKRGEEIDNKSKNQLKN